MFKKSNKSISSETLNYGSRKVLLKYLDNLFSGKNHLKPFRSSNMLCSIQTKINQGLKNFGPVQSDLLTSKTLYPMSSDFSEQTFQSKLFRADFSDQTSQSRLSRANFSEQTFQSRLLRADFSEQISQSRLLRADTTVLASI